MSKIHEALGKLDAGNDNHWTNDGLPRIETIRMLAGDQSITREQISAEAPQFCRANPVIQVSANQPTPVVPVATAPQGKSEEVPSTQDIAAAIAQKQSEVEALRVQIEDVQAAFSKAVSELDALIDSQTEAQGPHCNATAIQGYLEQQRKNLEERARRAKVLSEAGVTVADIQNLIPQPSPLDQSLSKKR